MLEKPIERNARIPAHKQVRSRILEFIHESGLTAGAKLPSEPEIADKLGVSRMTANKAILSLVAEGALVREKGRGTFVAAPARTATKFAVAVMSQDLGLAMEDYYFGALYWNVQATLATHGSQAELMRLDSNLSRLLKHEPGIIAINPSPSRLDVLQALAGEGACVVVLGASWPDVGLGYVDSDNRRGAAMAVEHLVGLGHREIAFLGACHDDSNSQDRVHGFQEAMRAHGLRVADSRTFWNADAVLWSDPIEDALFAEIRKGVTAVFAAGPHLAVHLLRACHRRGLRVPEDLSVVAYDDPHFLAMSHPLVTTIRQPLAEMARTACELLWNRLSTGDRTPVRAVLDPQLIVRESSAGPRAVHHLPGSSL
jgi:DNA-binding LacI/PurR family transcriptional regulator